MNIDAKKPTGNASSITMIAGPPVHHPPLAGISTPATNNIVSKMETAPGEMKRMRRSSTEGPRSNVPGWRLDCSRWDGQPASRGSEGICGQHLPLRHHAIPARVFGLIELFVGSADEVVGR